MTLLLLSLCTTVVADDSDAWHSADEFEFKETLVLEEVLLIPTEEFFLPEKQIILQTGATSKSLKTVSDYCKNDEKVRFTDLWDGKLEIGLNGASGNTNNINIVTGFDAKREIGLVTTTLDVNYLFTKDEEEVTKDRLFSRTRQIHDIENSDWGYFWDQWFEYDGLEDFKARYGLHVGGIKTITKTKSCLLQGLIGVGTSKEFAGTDLAWKPEVFLGEVWERTINDRQKIYIKSVIYPDMGDVGNFRLHVKAGWECALNKNKDFKLNISAFDRFDSTPSGGDNKNDIDYWTSLVWEF